MSKQVLDIEQMRHLSELGLDTSKASMCWVVNCNYAQHLAIYNISAFYATHKAIIPTFTLPNILDLLPKEIDAGFAHKWYLYVNYQKSEISYSYEDSKSILNWLNPVFNFSKQPLIDAAYEMLCWCIEKGYIETQKL